MTNLANFVSEVDAADLRDRTMFHRLVAEGLALTGVTLEQAAEEFKTAPGTVSRWKNGHAAPAVFSRPTILRFFRQRAQRMAKQQEAAAGTYGGDHGSSVEAFAPVYVRSTESR